MKRMAVIISVLLLATCAAIVALVAFTLPKGRKSRLHLLFTATGSALTIWTFGLALTAGASAQIVSIYGHRLMVFGWGLSACLFLQFLLVLTGMTRLQKKWWFSLLVYLPSSLVVFAFSILPFWGYNTETMVHTSLGWAYTPSSSVWSWTFYTQILLLMALSLTLLLRWARRSDSAIVRKQSMPLIIALPIAGICGFAADTVPGLAGIHIPQFSAVFMLIPVIMISIAVRKYRFLQPEQENPNEIILNKTGRSRIYLFLSAFSLLCSLLILLRYTLCESDRLPSTLLLSFLLMMTAACFIAISLLKLDNSSKELIAAFCLSFIIPITTLWSVRTANPTTWAFVFILMIASLLFNRTILLASVLTSDCLTLLFAWAYQPVTAVKISSDSYISRLFILGIAAILSLYVQCVYTRRLKENLNHTLKQSILSKVSHTFISATENNIDKKLYTVLEQCGRYIRCDRACLILLEDSAEIRSSREWLAPGISSALRELENSFRNIDPMIKRRLKSGKTYILRDTLLLPAKIGTAKKKLLEQGVRSLVAVPVKNGENLIGLLGFNAARPFRRWNLDTVDFLEVIAGIVADAILKVDAEKKINFIAYHDQLTGLPNRLLLNDRLEQAIAVSSRTEKMLAVVFIDLDSFKAINDTMGHDLGDQLLMQVSEMLSHSVRGYDTVSRFGGDEFILLLNQIPGTVDLLCVMDKLMDTLQRPILLNGQETFITASAGVALYPQDGPDAETLIKNADTAMYHAKGEGKNRYALCSKGMKNQILERMKLSNLLYRAQEKNQLMLYYQPQVDIERHAIVGSEALIRWNLPGHGMLMPATFIPVAEQTGLIQPIGAWVLETACRQNRHWQEIGFPEMRIGVNLSIHQLKNPKFAQQVRDILERTGLPPKDLELEITESISNGNIENIIDILNSLKALGVSISIDDFGTEYSSLSRLKLLPIDRIKMDMQFVQGIEKSEKDQAITKVIISLAKSLDLRVTAEGVETKPQLDFLSQRMCDEVQGFYYYHPMPADEMEAVLLHPNPN